MRAPSGRRSALRHQLRGASSGAAPQRQEVRRSAVDRGAEERSVVAQLHVSGLRRFRCPAAARRDAGLRHLRRRSRPDQRRNGIGEHRGGARPFGADPRGRRSAGDDNGFGSPDIGSAAGLAVSCRRRRAEEPSDRGSRPARHGNVELDRLPRPVRPSGDARPGAVPVRRRPGRQPRRDHPDGHHRLHRHHRARRLGLRQRACRRGHRAAAQHLGRADDRAAGHRQRRPGGAGLRRLASRQGGASGPRLAAAVGHRRRGRHRTTRQGRADRAGRVRLAVRGRQLPAGARPEGRRRRAARRRPRR